MIGKYNALVERSNRLNDDMKTATSEQASDSDDKAQHKVDYNRAKQDPVAERFHSSDNLTPVGGS